MSDVDPWVQFSHLSNLLESIPRERQLDSAIALLHAAHVVMRHAHGQRTDAEVRSALDVARSLIRAELKAEDARGAA